MDAEPSNTTARNTDFLVVGDYILRERIGGGPYSTVWKANHRLTPAQNDVALKQVYLSKLTPKLKACLECELNFLSSVTHPNIIRLLDFFQFEGCLFLVYEYCNGGDLASYICCHGRVPEQIAREFMKQLGSGLRTLQQHHIIHRDLKPENILLSISGTGTLLKIADFGLSRSLYTGDYAETVCGSPLYMAPEILGFERYNEKADMWSIGAILFELLNGYPPFHGRTSVQLLRNIKSSINLPFLELNIQKLHPDCFDMCSRLLSVSPVNRLSCEEFYCHRFLMQTEEGL